MPGIAKKITITFLLIALIITGFVVGIRSCLSRYDERSALPPVLYFKNDSIAILFSLVKFSKTTSYSTKGGFTNKSISNHYFSQTNNAFTGEKIAVSEIEEVKEIKHFPEVVMGAAGNNAWIFLNELMAIDAFSLRKFADIKIIENINPVLKGMMPEEGHYYHFNQQDKNILFTANDGVEWILNTTTLKAVPHVAVVKDDISHKIKLGQEALQDLQKMNSSRGETATSQDTANGRWTGLYSGEEIRQLNVNVSFSAANQRQQRRQLYTSTYSKAVSNFLIDTAGIQNVNPATYFLDAAFLRNKETGKIIRLANTDLLITYKSRIGTTGKIILAAISKSGVVTWTFDTLLSEWIDWTCKGNRLFIFGKDNKQLSSKECNILLSVDLQSGLAKKYDYFSDTSKP